jgi:tetratricopeptide (TPR) repeat protein
MSRPTAALLVALMLALAHGAALAADTPEPEPATRPAADPLAPARAHIEARRWPAALAALRQVNASGDADWNNLMGYTLRKQAQPDLDGAQRHYDAALKLNPKHLGALEYAGELALIKGDLATAETHRAALGRLCKSPCEPLDDLNKAIEAYKAGKR